MNINALFGSMLKDKNVKQMITKLQIAAEYITAFAETYMGEYDKDGNLIEKGDRDIFNELLVEINEKLNVVNQKIDELDERIRKIEEKINKD